MKPRQGFEIRVIAGATVLALLLQPAAFAQRDSVVASATQPSGEQFPDSPGTVQAAANHPLAVPSSAQADRSADRETTQPQQSEPANASAPQDPPLPAPSASSPTGTSATQSQPQEQPRVPVRKRDPLRERVRRLRRRQGRRSPQLRILSGPVSCAPDRGQQCTSCRCAKPSPGRSPGTPEGSP